MAKIFSATTDDKIETIDLGPDGPAGVEAYTAMTDHPKPRPGHPHRITWLWVEGSNHVMDWIHHVLPGARRREIRAAERLTECIKTEPGRLYIVGGHSLGGCIAAIVSDRLRQQGERAETYLFAPKRAPHNTRPEVSTIYRHRGDIVPTLPPWRPRWRGVTRIGKCLAPWRAHALSGYRTYMEEVGFTR